MLAGIGVSNWMVRALMAAQIFTSHPDRHHHHPLEFLSLFNRPPISPPIAVFPPTSRFASARALSVSVSCGKHAQPPASSAVTSNANLPGPANAIPNGGTSYRMSGTANKRTHSRRKDDCVPAVRAMGER
jgi:hypothetical protein